MIGIIGAMQQEVEALNAALSDKQTETVCGVCYTTGRLLGRDVVTAVCGMGKVLSGACAQTMILKYGPAAIINIGVGGSVADGLRIGDIVIGERLVQHDFDLSPIGYEKGLLPGMEGVHMRADGRLCEAAKNAADAAGYRCLLGVIATGDSFISSKEEKKRLQSEFGASACDMEGGSIAQVCASAGVPFCVIRAISDNADGEAGGDFDEFADDAAAKAIFVIQELVKGL